MSEESPEYKTKRGTCLNVNRILMAGRLTANPELRYTPSSKAVCNLSVATNETFKDGAGEIREEVCFVTCVLWGKQAELAAESFHKGDPIFFEGRLKLETWEKDGQKRSRHVIRIDKFNFVETKRADKPAETPEPAYEFEDDIPF